MRSRAALGSLLVALLAGQVPAQDPAGEAPGPDAATAQATRRVLAALGPSLVEVEALGGLEEEFKAPGSEAEAKEQGGILTRGGFKQAWGPTTGLVVREDGLVLTTSFALHREPRHLIVTLCDGRSFVARALGRDDARGLVLLKVEAKGLPVPPLASAEALKVGRGALALGRGLGHPRGAPTVSAGIVSGLGRVGGRAIQTSAAVSPMNYGGALASIDGQVLGLLVPLALDGGMASVDIYDSGIGFAIPAPELLRILPRLIKGEHLKPGFVGIEPDRLSRDGVRVSSVVPGSPAAAAGIVAGDVVLEADQVKTDFAWQLRRALGALSAGDPVVLTVRRGTTSRSVELRLADVPPPQREAPGPPEEDR